MIAHEHLFQSANNRVFDSKVKDSWWEDPMDPRFNPLIIASSIQRIGQAGAGVRHKGVSIR